MVDDQRIKVEVEVGVLHRPSEGGLCVVQPVVINVGDDGHVYVVVVGLVGMRVQQIDLGGEHLLHPVRKGPKGVGAGGCAHRGRAVE